jgi:hypothetical protein
VNENNYDQTYEEDMIEQRRKRSLQALHNLTLADAVQSFHLGNASVNETKQSRRNTDYEAAVVYDKKEIVLTNLKHFQEYSIEVNSTSHYCQVNLSFHTRCVQGAPNIHGI